MLKRFPLSAKRRRLLSEADLPSWPEIEDRLKKPPSDDHRASVGIMTLFR